MIERIGGEVSRELGRFGPAAGMADVVAAWPRLAGDAIARNAWPARLARDGTLHVATSSSAWAFELAQLAPTLLARLQGELGEAAPAALRFLPGSLPEAPPPTGAAARPAPVEPSAEDRELAAALTAGIGDESLREAAARAAAASLARPASDR